MEGPQRFWVLQMSFSESRKKRKLKINGDDGVPSNDHLINREHVVRQGERGGWRGGALMLISSLISDE